MAYFYTSVLRRGNNILMRGYDNGQRVKRKIRFKPTLYVRAKAGSNSQWHALDGTHVDPIKFESMSAAKEFTEMYQDVENFTIYGHTNYIMQYIADEFPGVIQFDRSKARVHTFDIEVYSGNTGGGFPKPEEAKHPVTAISLHDSITDVYYLWTLGDYDPQKTEHKDITIKHIKFDTEVGLLKHLVSFWADEFTCPDILTGWNIRTFDIPYLVNRITRLLGEDYAAKISPWGSVEQKQVSMLKGMVQVYEIAGVAQLDYIDIFKKFGNKFGPQENYRLDTIANTILGERKMSYDEYGTLTKLYEENQQLYNDYCLKDTILVKRFEDKIGFITLAMTMAYKAGVNYNDTLGTTAIWDQLIHRQLKSENTVIPPIKNRVKQKFEGAYVKETIVGRHRWLITFDVNSMHPNLIVLMNMSPETLLKGDTEPGVNVEKMLAGYVNQHPNKTISAIGQYFSKNKQGILPRMVEMLYSERVEIKAKMLDLKKKIEALSQQYDKNQDPVLKAQLTSMKQEAGIHESGEQAIKLFLNSLFGATGNAHFRYSALEIAESITVSSQFVIRTAENAINAYLNRILKTNKDYVVAMDTDSTMVVMDELVKRAFQVEDTSTLPRDKVVDFLDKVGRQIEEDVLKPAFDQLTKNVNAFKPRMAMKREVIADVGIYLAPKNYIMSMLDKEGVRYAEPKLKIMGIEAIKSSTPGVCRDAFKPFFELAIRGTEQEIHDYVQTFKDKFRALPVEDIAAPRGVSSVKDYMDSKTIYRKGTPMNSRAAILYNHLLKKHGLTDKYEAIGDGDKIKFVSLKMPNPLRENVIGFITVLPPEFNLHRYVDFDDQFDKTFTTPAARVLNPIGWNVEPTASLEDFFG